MKNERPKNYDCTKINYSKLTWKATAALMEVDEKFIGTINYMGIGYFWTYEYRYPMRDIPFETRQKIHLLFLKHDLAVDACTPKHTEIINQVISKDKKALKILKYKFGGPMESMNLNHEYIIRDYSIPSI